MKAIVITTDNKASVREFSESQPLFRETQPILDGYMEHVHPRRLPHPYCMLVNDEGLLRELPPNPMGCLLYETDNHGAPIVGNLILMKDGYRGGEPDILGLTDDDVTFLGSLIAALSGGKVHL